MHSYKYKSSSCSGRCFTKKTKRCILNRARSSLILAELYVRTASSFAVDTLGVFTPRCGESSLGDHVICFYFLWLASAEGTRAGFTFSIILNNYNVIVLLCDVLFLAVNIFFI